MFLEDHYRPQHRTRQQIRCTPTTSSVTTTGASPRWAPSNWLCYLQLHHQQQLLEHGLDGLPQSGHAIIDYVISYNYLSMPSTDSHEQVTPSWTLSLALTNIHGGTRQAQLLQATVQPTEPPTEDPQDPDQTDWDCCDDDFESNLVGVTIDYLS